MASSNDSSWNLVLNKKQRDNLLFVLNLIGCGGTLDKFRGLKPFTLVGGDWACEIVEMLGKPSKRGDSYTYTIGEGDNPDFNFQAVEKEIELLFGVKQQEHGYVECSHGTCWACGQSWSAHKSSLKLPQHMQCIHKVTSKEEE